MGPNWPIKAPLASMLISFFLAILHPAPHAYWLSVPCFLACCLHACAQGLGQHHRKSRRVSRRRESQVAKAATQEIIIPPTSSAVSSSSGAPISLPGKGRRTRKEPRPYYSVVIANSTSVAFIRQAGRKTLQCCGLFNFEDPVTQHLQYPLSRLN